MLVLTRALLNKEYNLIIVLEDSVSNIYMCNLHAIFLSKITPTYFTEFTKGMFRSLNVRRESGGVILWEK
jgi:hypothetical protein